MDMTILTIVGARPQFVKASVVSAILRQRCDEYLVHTGQHYDHNMSQLFFDEMNIPRPDLNLNIGSGPHGEQTANMLIGLEKVVLDVRPDMVLIYGDTNSTLAGAIVAGKLNIPVAHVEAGLRSFNRRMPEEINRLLADRLADKLFCPTQTAVEHLQKEGVTEGVYLTGDVMFDAALHFSNLAEKKGNILQTLGLEAKSYVLATCHRPQNTDDRQAFTQIIEAMIESREEIVFPVHPRSVDFIQRYRLADSIERAKNIHLIDPVGYLEMIQLEKNAKKILTDSGGVQKEAYFFKVPCITMRRETEWIETVIDGWNILTGSDKDKIKQALNDFEPADVQRNHYGDGHASERIVDLLCNK